MKIMISLVALLFWSSVRADGPCVGLAEYVGVYQLTNESCDHDWFGPDLTVAPFPKDSSWPQLADKAYWIVSASGGFAPTTLTDGSDPHQCTLSDHGLKVEIDGNVIPGPERSQKRNASFLFLGSRVIFQADRCTATYLKSSAVAD